MATIAAIDCGTNTIKLLIGDLPQVAVRQTRMVRLGQGVDATGELHPDALERAFAALDEYAVLIAEHGVTPDRIRFCATSATRDASNAAVFAEGVQARLGVRPEVIPGAEEAQLAYSGAIRGLAGEVAHPVLVIDIGGGSTELILGDADGPVAAHSADIGSVRLAERHLHSDPSAPDEVAACVADIEAALDAAEAAGVDISAATTVVGIAGTCTTIAAGVLMLPAYDADAVDHAVLPVASAREFCADLVAATTAERRALPFMHPGRADVIDAGALIMDRILARVSVDTWTVSEADILEGIAWSVHRRVG
ncbi:Ppx/GppA phosphatase family protein [Nocardioides jishulii]|uniref:Ppx/GppA family phosphatase n=1 Tax=Nocardioides jishulii TaxID=2575440 RepID=A0A4U2YH58_9ACTN|nr:Ppx/GppA phosphatase family protein [Nocardioides jishulii]TKI60367.1 Ppx/GppA family phosphatase [Nocardioides jishulii]